MIVAHPRAECDALRRTLILGNSGSGKSWLAAQLSERLPARVTDLDSVHWLPGSLLVPRDRQAAMALVRAAAAQPDWIIEGVYGWLAQLALANAGTLIWLRIPVAECIGNLRQRGIRRGGDAASFAALLAWAAEYETRATSSSRVGHADLFDAFAGQKVVLASRQQVGQFLEALPRAADRD